MQRISVRVASPTGLHAGPARQFVQAARRYACDIAIKVRGQEFDAKSMIGILGAGVQCRDEIEIICRGAQEQKACKALAELVSVNMDERQLWEILGSSGKGDKEETGC